jgi:electron transfer flavoprotein alpha subunit
MSVIVFAENNSNKFTKPTFEALSYAYAVAKSLSTDLVAVSLGQNVPDSELEKLNGYGAKKVISINNQALENFDSMVYASILKDIIAQENGTVIIASSTYNGKSLSSRLSAKLKAGMVSNVSSLPTIEANNFIVNKAVYSGKGFATFNITTPIKILTLSINSYKVEQNQEPVSIQNLDFNNNKGSGMVITGIQKSNGAISLTDADIVVSGGRGLKGPENWHLITDMAELLGAATACSKPVSDIGWRPHSEHVGQTGLTVAPNLYIAVGISGAIQHLAGINRSKVIVCINKDAEAPFFKAADYGIVGDAFEVMPKLIEAIRKVKAA